MATSQIFKLLRESLNRIPVIDTHEQMGKAGSHVCSGMEEMFCRLMPRQMGRILAGGRPDGPGGNRAGRASPPEGMALLRPGWEKARSVLSTVQNTMLYRYALATLGDLFNYHEKDIDESGWKFLSDQIRQRTAEPSWPRIVLNEKANIETIFCDYSSLTPQPPPWARDIVFPLLKVDHFLFAGLAKGRKAIERRYNVTLNNLTELLGLVEGTIRTAANSGFVALKSRLAAFRTLHIENVTLASAQGIFEKGGVGLTPEEAKKFQDFMFHAIVQCAILHNLPIQINAGLDEAGSRTLDRANPLHLTDLIFNYADARFAILHGGFPFTSETAVMAKTFPNIYLDGTWLQHASASTAKSALHEWLELVPYGKIMIWGGDTRCPEASYASLLMVKDVLAEVLTEKVESGYFGEAVAVDVAWKLFRENAKSFYNIERARRTFAPSAPAVGYPSLAKHVSP